MQVRAPDARPPVYFSRRAPASTRCSRPDALLKGIEGLRVREVFAPKVVDAYIRRRFANAFGKRVKDQFGNNGKPAKDRGNALWRKRVCLVQLLDGSFEMAYPRQRRRMVQECKQVL